MKINSEKLLKSLTLAQKLAQLAAGGPYKEFVTSDNKFNCDLAREAYPNGFFGIMAPVGLTPEEIGEWVCDLRKYEGIMQPCVFGWH